MSQVEIVDAPWLARGEPGSDYGTLRRHAHGWRHRHYDLAINFEGDIRSHGLMALSRARRRVGFGMAGGGPLLTDVSGTTPRVMWRPTALRSSNARSTCRLALCQRRRRSKRWPSGGCRCPSARRRRPGRHSRNWPEGRFPRVSSGSMPRAAGKSSSGPPSASPRPASGSHVSSAPRCVLTGGPEDASIVDGVELSLKQAGVTTLRVQGTVDLVILAGVLGSASCC